MEFEFDPAKSAANKDKHGIDFVEAQALWQDDRLADAPIPSEDEPRVLIIGRLEGKHWTAIRTLRGEAVRIILVRRSQKVEISYYEDS